jgi:crossover junction endodeoxyribonuclease RuvC
MADRCIVGIDPGLSGALAFIFQDEPNRVAIEDMPVADGDICAPLLSGLIRKYAPSYAVIEFVASMPGQGVASTFKFGKSYGQAIGVLGSHNVPLHYVTPKKWKQRFNLLKTDKEASRNKALQLFPACAESFRYVKHHNRADAALIAKYGLEVLFPWSTAA